MLLSLSIHTNPATRGRRHSRHRKILQAQENRILIFHLRLPNERKMVENHTPTPVRRKKSKKSASKRPKMDGNLFHPKQGKSSRVAAAGKNHFQLNGAALTEHHRFNRAHPRLHGTSSAQHSQMSGYANLMWKTRAKSNGFHFRNGCWSVRKKNHSPQNLTAILFFIIS